jgi:hypothetical protein
MLIQSEPWHGMLLHAIVCDHMQSYAITCNCMLLHAIVCDDMQSTPSPTTGRSMFGDVIMVFNWELGHPVGLFGDVM